MLVVVIAVDYSVGLLLRRCGLEKEKVTGASRKLYNIYLSCCIHQVLLG